MRVKFASCNDELFVITGLFSLQLDFLSVSIILFNKARATLREWFFLEFDILRSSLFFLLLELFMRDRFLESWGAELRYVSAGFKQRWCGFG